MDVQRNLLAVAFLFVLSACGNQKTAESVFPENNSLDSSACLGKSLSNKFIVQWEDGNITVEHDIDADSFKKNFIEPRLSDIKYVEYDRVIQVKDRQEVQASATNDNWGQSRIGVAGVYSQGVYGQGIKVGIVDAFVDTSHPQLLPRIAVNTQEIPDNGFDDDRNGIVDDYYGAVFVSEPGSSQTVSSHGTHVAGIIAADPNFGPVQGVAPQAQLIPAQFIANDGGGHLGDAILAMQYTAQRGAKVINASWGGAPCVTSLLAAFQELEKNGVLVVVAAGNDGRNVDSYPEFPASFNLSNQLTVAASDISELMTSWSNSGFNSVHVAAPGASILSTVPDGKTAYMDGTSMAAPMVSGAAALLWSARPNATAVDIKKALMQSVDIYQGREFKVKTRGRINVQKALEVLKQLVP